MVMLGYELAVIMESSWTRLLEVESELEKARFGDMDVREQSGPGDGKIRGN